MPLLGHGLIGAGVAAATQRDVGASKLAGAWPGLCVLLAYGPDLLEWPVIAAGLPLVHGAPASLLVSAAAGLGIFAVWRTFGGRSWMLLWAALAAWMSHPLFDALSGGVPLLWPWSSALIGADYLGVDSGTHMERLVLELRWFLPVVMAGALVAICRVTRSRRRAWAAGASFLLGLIGAAVGSVAVLAVAAAALILIAGWSLGLPRVRTVAMTGVVLMPLLALGAAEAYAYQHVSAADAYYRAGQWRQALAAYDEARRFCPVAGTAPSLYLSALCHRRLGEIEAARALYEDCLRRFPGHTTAAFGLALLCLHEKDPAYHDPRRAIALMEEAIAAARSPEQRAAYQRVLDDARRAVADEH